MKRLLYFAVTILLSIYLVRAALTYTQPALPMHSATASSLQRGTAH